MATNASTFVRDKVLNVILGTGFGTPPPNLFGRLYNGNPGRDGTGGSDITTSVRAAGAVAIASSGWSSITTPQANRRQIETIVDLNYGNAVSSVSVTHIGLWDAASGGNFWFGIESPFTTTAGASTVVAAGQIRAWAEFGTQYLSDLYLNAIKGSAFASPPANLYGDLYSVSPSFSGSGGTSVITSVRAGRLVIPQATWGSPTANANARRIANNSAIAFGNSLTTVSGTHMALWDAASAGNMWALISSPFSAIAGSPLSAAINGFVWEMP